jgi:hypothetical protein
MGRSQNIEDWASAYVAFQQDGRSSDENHPLWWAAERFMEDPGAEDCWSAILAVLAKNPPDSVIGILAAGPLEDLIHQAGPQYIDRIELEARRNPAFRHLLGGVWQSSTPDVWARIESTRGGSW